MDQEGKLHNIREHKKDVDSIFVEIMWRQEPEPVTAQRGGSQRAWSVVGQMESPRLGRAGSL